MQVGDQVSQSQPRRGAIDSVAPPSRPPVIQSAVLSQVKPASISHHCPKKARKADKTRSLSQGHLVFPYPALAAQHCKEDGSDFQYQLESPVRPTKCHRSMTSKLSWLSTCSMRSGAGFLQKLAILTVNIFFFGCTLTVFAPFLNSWHRLIPVLLWPAAAARFIYIFLYLFKRYFRIILASFDG